MINFQNIDQSVQYCIRKIFNIQPDVSSALPGNETDEIIRKYSDDSQTEAALIQFNSVDSDKAYAKFANSVKAREIKRRRERIVKLFYFSVPAAAILIIALFLTGIDKSGVTVINREAFDKSGEVLLITDKGSHYSTQGEIKIIDKEIRASKKKPIDIEIPVNITEEQINQLVTPRGIRQKITLSDGTVVWVNSGSRLSFPTEFKDSIRRVSLTGEAFFDVSKSAKPFIVKLNTGEVRVFGTTFNIVSYENSTSSDISLYTGSVKVITSGMSLMLDPGYNVQINNMTSLISAPVVNQNDSPDWMRGRMEFYSQPLSKVFEVIERWYGVECELADDTRDLPVTIIVSDKTIFTELAELLELTQTIKINIERNRVLITKTNY
jgi:hypothetical protein